MCIRDSINAEYGDQALSTMPDGVSAEMADELIGLMDVNDDGTLSEAEIVRFWNHVTGSECTSADEIEEDDVKCLVDQPTAEFRKMLMDKAEEDKVSGMIGALNEKADCSGC
eukprot:TRINITY_DN8792_c0_g1_i1.p2 TRINITY_DN8792_c0_g1~~TRINITY_DN8792_c0_g1_i1.p2  ORF type:complete len:124 (+),score=56.88 TRINITY_DN8792_c0_g1_i1:39-374(+)